MTDAITILGHIAAVCDVEAESCGLKHHERVELRRRAVAYRAEQVRCLEALPDNHAITAAVIEEWI